MKTMIIRLKKFIATALIAAIIPTAAFAPSVVMADDTVDSAAIIADAIAGGAHRCNVKIKWKYN